MIGKAGLVAAIVISAVASGRQVDMRGLYDQMYPVSTLKRDALNLCHESDPTFVRAWHGDRQACYSAMPHAIALALGFIHPSSALAGLFSPVGGGLLAAGSLLADAGFASQATMSRQPPLTSRLTNGKQPCREPVAGLAALPARTIDTETALDVLSGHRGPVDGTALKELHLPQRAGNMPSPGDSLTLLDASADVDLGNPRAAAAAPDLRCETRG